MKIQDPKLVELYSQVHSEVYYGASSENLLGYVQKEVGSIGIPLRRILDYGCGRSRLADWLGKLHDAEVVKFDPGIPAYSTLPEGKFDLVLCTDVLEHIPEELLIANLKLLSSYTSNVFFRVSVVPAKFTLPDGRNAHVTVRPREWWGKLISLYFPVLRLVPPVTDKSFCAVTWPPARTS